LFLKKLRLHFNVKILRTNIPVDYLDLFETCGNYAIEFDRKNASNKSREERTHYNMANRRFSILASRILATHVLSNEGVNLMVLA